MQSYNCYIINVSQKLRTPKIVYIYICVCVCVRVCARAETKNPMVTREELQEDMRPSGCSVTKGIISNEIRRNGLKSRRPKKTPVLLKRQRDARFKFVRQEKKNSFWEKVLWTYETKIELFGHNNRNHVWGKDGKAYSPKNTVPTVKLGGGSIMIWECFSAKGVGKISVIIFTQPLRSGRIWHKVNFLRGV